MADLSSLLAALEIDPDDANAYDALAAAARQVASDERATRFAATRMFLSARHRPDRVAQLIDIELEVTDEPPRRADLWIEKAQLLDGELLDIDGAKHAFAAAIVVRGEDAVARESLDDLQVAATNWQRFAHKYVGEASAASDRSLATDLYVSAAECYLRFSPDAPEAEQWLRRALEIDRHNARAAFHLGRLLRRKQRWRELAALLDQRADSAPQLPDRIAALVQLADVARGALGDSLRADRAIQRVAELDPCHPRVERMREHGNSAGSASSLLELAQLAESLGNPDKAVDAWKQHLRADPGSEVARAALARLYRRTEKWNALLDLTKEAFDRVAETDVTARIARLFEIVEIYRDHLKLDSMVIHTYQAILQIDSSHARAADELAVKLRAAGRWNDVIALLTRRAENPATLAADRLTLLREVADIWSDRLGNAANAIGPLEQILAADPTNRDATTRLKEIYAKRRQWRQLIELLGTEAANLPAGDRIAKRAEMARIAAERLGDTRLAIELYNRVLGEADEADVRAVWAALAELYERDKRYVALVEIVHRQAAAALAATPRDDKAAIAAFERAGKIYGERLFAPQHAALAWKQLFELDPTHTKALRELRELYLTSGDGAGLEPLFIELGLEDELIDAMHSGASRSDDRAVRLSLVERAASLAGKRAASAGADQASRTTERARQAWERVLAVEPRHVQAAAALAAIYERQQKWPRVLAMREIELDAAADAAAQLAKIAQIRDLCEHRLGSKSLAFTWAIRAFEIDLPPHSLVGSAARFGGAGTVDPTSHTIGGTTAHSDDTPAGDSARGALYDDVLRLASEPEQWREVVGALERAISSGRLSETAQLQAFRDLAKIAAKRLGDPEMARGYHRKVLQLAPADRDAELDLERLATQAADWDEVLGSLRRRAKRVTDPSVRASVLVQAGLIQEQKLVDPQAAAASYRQALEARPGHSNALRSLARVEEARGEWASLADVWAQELSLVPVDQRFEPLMRLAALELDKLHHGAAALGYYRQALAIAGPGIRPQPVDAIARLVLESPIAATIPADQRTAAVREIVPHLVHADQFGRQALALTVLRNSNEVTEGEKVELDRELMRVFEQKLGDIASAWEAGLRIVAAAPHDTALRATMAALSGRLGRDGQWAQQLVNLLDHLTAHESAPAQLRELAAELARFATDRVGDDDIAEAAWIAVLEIEADAKDAFSALANLYRARERWLDLRALLERRAEATSDEAERLAVWLQLGALERDNLGERELATSAYRRALELDPTSEPARVALEQLYAEAENWRALEALLASWGQRGLGTEQAVERTFHRAILFAHYLDDPDQAVDLLDGILRSDRDHVGARELLEKLLVEPKAAACRLAIARILEPLYAADHLWQRHVAVLRVLRDLADGRQAVELLMQIASESESKLGAPQDAFDAWMDVLTLEPGNDRARAELLAVAAPLQRWREVAAALEASVSAIPPGDRFARLAVLSDLAEIYENKLEDPERAIGVYLRWRDADLGSTDTIRHTSEALVRLYRTTNQWAELLAVLRAQADCAQDSGERVAALASAAKLEEEIQSDRTAAIETWRRVLHEHPQDSEALSSLERLLEAEARWQELVDLLRYEVETVAIADRVDALARIARICDRRLAASTSAIAAWREVLDCDADDQEALAELARLYRVEGRHGELHDIYLRQLSMVDAPPAQSVAQASEPAGKGPRRRELHIEVARLLSGPLVRPIDALEHWRAVLTAEHVGTAATPGQELSGADDERSALPVAAPTAIDPYSAEALSAVEAMLGDGELWREAVEILHPVYVATGRYDSLVGLYRLRADRAEDSSAKFQNLREIVLLYEHHLSDKHRAFDAQLQALTHAANEPELAAAISHADRLAGELGRPSDLIDVYRALAPDVLDADLQRRLYLDVADLLRAIRNDVEAAADCYRNVLELAPSDTRATAALENIYRAAGDTGRLVDILLRQASSEFGATADDQVSSLVEAAGLLTALGRPDDAIAAWEQVLSIAPDRADAIYALEKLYREQSRWKDVIDLYERRLGFVTSIDEAVALRVQMAQLHESCGEIEAAVEDYAAALDGNARHPVTLAALERLLGDPVAQALVAQTLEPLYIADQRWPDLVAVYLAKRDATTEPSERLKLTRYVARLYEEQLEDYRAATEWYAQVFRESPADPQARDQLQRLAGVAGTWDVVVEAYQGYLDEESVDSPNVRDVAIAAASIYDLRLAASERAVAAYRRALAIELASLAPDSNVLIGRLEAVLGRTCRWNELVAIYDDVIEQTSSATLRVETETKRARLLEEGLHDVAEAIAAWRALLDSSDASDDAGSEAAAQLERLYRTQSQWRELADLLESRLVRADDPVLAGELRLKLAALYEGQLDDLTAAIDHYRNALTERALAELAIAALERLVVHDEHRAEIIELLEPVYRNADWWQKLAVILDAKLEFIADSAQQVAILHEIAAIHDNRGGALDLAFAALQRAWRIDVCDDAALGKLLTLADKLETWEQAAKTVEAGANAAPSEAMAAELWAQAAAIQEVKCRDRKRAIAAWRKVDELRPDDVAALAALDRLLALEGLGAELAQIVDRRAEQATDDSVRLVLLHRAATLYDEEAGDRDRAIEVYRRILDIDAADLAALDELERLYRDRGDFRELVATLERKIELAADDSARQTLHHSVAVVYEVELKDVVSAVSHLDAALRLDGSDRIALSSLDRIHTADQRWPELIAVLDRRAAGEADAAARADLAYRAATLVEAELDDLDAAVGRYAEVLEQLPSHPSTRSALERLMQRDDVVEAAAAALERVYRAESDVSGLHQVYERRLAAADRSPDARRADWQAFAGVYEELARQPAEAFAVWARAWAETPEDVEMFSSLLRLAEQASPPLWSELVLLLHERLRQPDLASAVEQTYAMSLGQIAEDRLQDLDTAATAFERASRGPEPRAALASLERVFARDNKSQQLVGVLARQAEIADSDATAAEYLFRKGDLSETMLGSRAEAIAAYIEALTLLPSHRASRVALQRLVQAGEEAERLRILDVLEPLFEQDGDLAELLSVLEIRVPLIDDPMDYAQALQRIAALHEVGLGDSRSALDVMLRWLAADPGSPDAQAEVIRLGDAVGEWNDIEHCVAEIAADEDAQDLDPEDGVSLLVFLGDIRRTHLNHVEGAIAAYRAALSFDAQAVAALDPLIELLRQMSAWTALADALRQRSRLASEPGQRRAALAEIAELSERAGDRFGAIAAWREIVDDDDRDAAALGELARLYRGSGLAEDRAQLVDVLDRAAQLAEGTADQKRLRVEIAELEAVGPRAVDAWRAVVDLDPGDPASLLELEAAYARAADWGGVRDVQLRRLEAAPTAADKLSICAEMARVSEERNQSIDDAIAAWQSCLEIDSAFVRAYDELERLLAMASRYGDLVEVLQRSAVLQAGQGDRAGQIQSLCREADIFELKLDEPDAATRILEEILLQDPGSVAALTRLSATYQRAGNWPKCKDTLERALQQNPQGRDAADLYVRLGEVARSQDGDMQIALQHFQHAVRQDGTYMPAITALEQIARARGDDALLLDMLHRRRAAAHGPEQVEILVEIADLERKAGHGDAALKALTAAAQADPDNIRVLAPLADAYVAMGRLDDASPIYDRLAAEAKAARRMKDVATYRQRQGAVFEARGDRDRALAAYEEAMRINPTDVPTMGALGRLYFTASEWDKARRIYQSLVLQNIDGHSGLSKGEVYWTLGTIHLALGEAGKAKSMWQRGLEIEPDHQALKDALARIG